ncbi:hypothetical protein AAG570_001326 [Ranatra chinensis]|uniref:CUB domain-containing protein n=1 Tax=Ranatra chinensis TaxID=642074 RepID=A0ABD0YQC8_9HEMI
MRELYKRCLIVFLTCCIQAYVGPLTQPPCDRSRRVFTDSWGIITDGPPGSNYTQDSHCEWLIKANNSEQFITLKFQSMGTECSYDYVYVYDGDSFNSPLLGSFSGKTEPQEITATSGYMLILLYSDTNYVLEGFRAEYTISNCSRNCSNHGFCLEHSCICEVDWGGRDCSFKLCQENCGYPERGVCSQGKCICTPNYSGLSCTMYKYDNTGNKWHWIFSGGISPRAAHTAIYEEGTNSLYVFGGYDLNNVLGDLMIFRFNSTRWEDEDGIVVGMYFMKYNM